MNQEKIGKFIAERRKNKKLTQEQLANELGVTSKSVSRWENGKTMPDYSILEDLTKILGISLNEFYYGEYIPKEKIQEISEENLRFILKTKYRKEILLSRAMTGLIMGILIFIIVKILFIK